MESIQNGILLIMPTNEENKHLLPEILKKNNFCFFQVQNFSEGIQIALENSYEMIICEHEMHNFNGFNFYKTLKPFLSKKNVPFLLILSEFRKKDVLIGLEMGIDSFIFYPFIETEIINKISHHLNKSKTIKGKGCAIYKDNFESAPVAKFISENEYIIRVNNEFTKITGISNNMISKPLITQVFNFSADETNELNFGKLMSGLLFQYLFESVPLISNESQLFKIHLVFHSCFEINNFVAEMIPYNQPEFPQRINNTKKFVEKFNEKTGNDKSEQYLVLTEREREILELSAKGLAIKQIADELKLSDRTVEKHRSNIMEKTNAHSIIEVIHFFKNLKD